MWQKNVHILRGITALVVVAFALWLAYYLRDNELALAIVAKFGYLGIFVIAAISGFNIILPVPTIAFMPLFVASGFSPLIVVLVITLGMTFGDFIGFLIGRAGRELVSQQTTEKWAGRLEHFREKYRTSPIIFLFVWVSLVPFPNETIIVPLAFLGFRFRVLIPTVFAGNIVFNTLATFGLVNIEGFL